MVRRWVRAPGSPLRAATARRRSHCAVSYLALKKLQIGNFSGNRLDHRSYVSAVSSPTLESSNAFARGRCKLQASHGNWPSVGRRRRTRLDALPNSALPQRARSRDRSQLDAASSSMLRHAARALAGSVPRLTAVTEVAGPRLRVQEALVGSLQSHGVLSAGASSWRGRAYATEASKEGEKEAGAEQAEGAQAEGTSTADDVTLEQLKEKLEKSEKELEEHAKQVRPRWRASQLLPNSFSPHSCAIHKQHTRRQVAEHQKPDKRDCSD